MAMVPTLDPGLIALVMTSQPTQAILGLSASADMVRRGYLQHIRLCAQMRFYTHVACPCGNMDSAADRESEEFIFNFSTDYVLRFFCFPLHFWKKPCS